TDPFEVVFSTGGELTRSALAGLVWDRTTGAGVDGLTVVAVADEDSVQHVARTDSGGIYAMRYLPPGRYSVTAFQDRNRNDEIDPMELQGLRRLQLPGEDTLLVDVPVLQPDTLPARLTAVDVLDSVTVVLTFDDYVDPDIPASQVSAALTRDSVAPEGPSPAVERAFLEHEYVLWVQDVVDSIARLDSLARAEREARARILAADTGAVVVDTVPPPDSAAVGDTLAPVDSAAATARPGVPPALPGMRGAPAARRAPMGREDERGPPRGPDGSVLPGRRIVLRLDAPLEVEVGYLIRVAGVTNIARVPLGGGERALMREAPPEEEGTPRDTARADTLGLPPDTGSVALRVRSRARRGAEPAAGDRR
ncbi:MAG TPA: carboxypeptidase regulatory-like domain-containing protein, partial [Longimicrobiales bacterium]|nr:carboxypeptidase regulatory-like domain-containing protein [Longimicrobiales bacterium]